MILYQFPTSPHCLKVRAVAHELGVPLELVPVRIFSAESRQPAFEALNPNGLVPVLVDGDWVLWESNAIVTYLAAIHPTPALLPTEPRARADVDRWLHWQSAHLGPAISKLGYELFIKPMTGQGAPDHAVAAKAAAEFQLQCGALEASLRGKEYVATSLSVADFALACHLSSAAMVGFGVEAFARTNVWFERMLSRASMRRAIDEARTSIHELDLTLTISSKRKPRGQS